MAGKSGGGTAAGLVSKQFRSSSLLRPRPYVLHAMKRFDGSISGALQLRVWNAVITAAKSRLFLYLLFNVLIQ
jgi:hypothetical protein